jgi:hypothetical protein
MYSNFSGIAIVYVTSKLSEQHRRQTPYQLDQYDSVYGDSAGGRNLGSFVRIYGWIQHHTLGNVCLHDGLLWYFNYGWIP